MKQLANSTCAALEYERLDWAAVAEDEEEVPHSPTSSPQLLLQVDDIQYVGLEGLAVGVDFEPVTCPKR